MEELQKFEADRDAPDLQEDLTWDDPTQAQKKANRFLKWLNKNRCFTDNIRLQLNEDKNSYEIYTVQSLEKYTCVFPIDSSVIITTDWVKNVRSETKEKPKTSCCCLIEFLKRVPTISYSEILPMDEQPPDKQLSGMIEARTNGIRLALFLLHEKYVLDRKSFWKPYLDVLPRLSSYLYLCTYTKTEMELLKNSRQAFREISQQNSE